MKAIVCTNYGRPLEVLQLKEAEQPVPEPDQVLLKVYSASLNISDLAPMRGVLLARLLGTGLLHPKRTRLGSDAAGRIEAVGTNVKQFQSGDKVFGFASASWAEYACAREVMLALKPDNVTFEEAAAVPVAGITALQGLRKGQIQSAQRVLINGASGGVGTFAVQIAKSFGAEVTAVCSPGNVDQARSMGADHVIDYTREDFTRKGQEYDLILAVNGYQPIPRYRDALTVRGRCIVLGGKMAQIFQALVLGPMISKDGGRTLGFMGIAKRNQKDLVFLKELLEAGKIKPRIDRRYLLSETAEAARYLEQGHARGKLVITLE